MAKTRYSHHCVCHIYQGHTYLPYVSIFQLCHCFSNIFNQKYILCTRYIYVYMCIYTYTYTHRYLYIHTHIKECLFLLCAIHMHYTILKMVFMTQNWFHKPLMGHDQKFEKHWARLMILIEGKRKLVEFPS